MTERDLNQDGGRANPSSYPAYHENRTSFNQGQPQHTSEASGGAMKQRLAEDLQSVKETAKSQLADASHAAEQMAAEHKNVIADKLGGIAGAVEKVAAELEQGDQRDVGRIARTIGSSVRSFSEDIKDRDLSEVARMAEDFGRKQPLAFLGLAAMAGLAASRFLKASSEGTSTGSSKPMTSQEPMTSQAVYPQPAASTSLGMQPASNPSLNQTSEDRFNG
jgi:ElaB/YqjD/DUF883 family membrane-anchored ribosome-binding protein